MGTHVDGAYVAEFDVARPINEVWQVLAAKPGEDPAWMNCWPSMEDQAARGEVLEVRDERHLRLRKLTEPCADTLIEISLAECDAGTRVTVRQSELPDWALHSIDTFVLGGDQIAADLALLLDRGVQICRHGMPWSFAGLLAREVASGLEITMVLPGTWAQRVGLKSGDLLLTMGETPVFTLLCLQAMQRVNKTGDSVAATWVRDESVLSSQSVI